MMVVWLTMYMVHNPSKYDDVICEQPLKWSMMFSKGIEGKVLKLDLNITRVNWVKMMNDQGVKIFCSYTSTLRIYLHSEKLNKMEKLKVIYIFSLFSFFREDNTKWF